MISPTLLEIDRSIRSLSLEEQMWLLERLVRHWREKTHTDASMKMHLFIITDGLTGLAILGFTLWSGLVLREQFRESESSV